MNSSRLVTMVKSYRISILVSVLFLGSTVILLVVSWKVARWNGAKLTVSERQRIELDKLSNGSQGVSDEEFHQQVLELDAQKDSLSPMRDTP